MFAVLIEYTLVLYLTDKEKQTREEKRHKYKKKRTNPEKQVSLFKLTTTYLLKRFLNALYTFGMSQKRPKRIS